MQSGTRGQLDNLVFQAFCVGAGKYLVRKDVLRCSGDALLHRCSRAGKAAVARRRPVARCSERKRYAGDDYLSGLCGHNDVWQRSCPAAQADGASGKVPGALLAEDVQAALQRLEVVSESDEHLSQPGRSAEGENNNPAVSHPHRTLPLINCSKLRLSSNATSCGTAATHRSVLRQECCGDDR